MLFRKSRARQSIQRLGISKIFFKCSNFGSTIYDMTGFLKEELTKSVKVPYDEAFYNWLRSKLKKKPLIDTNNMIDCEMQHYYIYMHPSKSGWLSKHGFKEYVESMPRQLNIVDSSFDISDMGQVLTKALLGQEEKNSFDSTNMSVNPFVLSLEQQIYFLYNILLGDGDFLIPFLTNLLDKHGQVKFSYLDAGNLIPDVIDGLLIKFSGLAYTSDDREKIYEIEKMKDIIINDIKEQKEKKGSGSRREQECITRLEWMIDLGIINKNDSRNYEFTKFGKVFVKEAGNIYNKYIESGFPDRSVSELLDNNFYQLLNSSIYPNSILDEDESLIEFIGESYNILKGISGYCLLRPLLLLSNILSISKNNKAYIEYRHGRELLEKVFKEMPDKIYFTTDRFGEDVQVKLM